MDCIESAAFPDQPESEVDRLLHMVRSSTLPNDSYEFNYSPMARLLSAVDPQVSNFPEKFTIS
jgi:hypothetical protein